MADVTSAAPGGRDLRPLAVAALTAALSLGLVVAAARWAWTGPDVGRGDATSVAQAVPSVRIPA